MFNERDLVIGTVILKGRIEVAGFAVSARDVVRFLAESTSTTGPEGKVERQWSDASGTRQIEGAFVAFKEGVVQIKRSDNGQELSLPLVKIGSGDQFLIEMLNKRRN